MPSAQPPAAAPPSPESMLSSAPVIFLISSATLMLTAGLCGLLACHCCLAVYILRMTAAAARHDLGRESRRAEQGPSTPPITTPAHSPPPQPTNDTPDDHADHLCYACVDLDANTALLACGHRGLCLACATRLWQVDRRCPLCRRGVEGVVFLG